MIFDVHKSECKVQSVSTFEVRFPSHANPAVHTTSCWPCETCAFSMCPLYAALHAQCWQSNRSERFQRQKPLQNQSTSLES